MRLPGLPEASGLALSRRTPGRLWTHNDSGDPVLIALDASGSVTGRLRLDGVTIEDWEAVAVGPCAAGSCLYVGDIGDNDAERRTITVHRIPEADTASGSVSSRDTLRITYPDGAHDAETLLVTAAGEILIVTKGTTGAVALYRLPANAAPGSTTRLVRVASPGGGERRRPDRITDGSVSRDGRWVLLRTIEALEFHRTDTLLAECWTPVGRVSLAASREPQGDGVAFGANGTIYLAGEGGRKSQPGTFTMLTCTLPHA